MRDLETVDGELRLLAAARRAVVENGGPPSSIRLVDELLDERAALNADPLQRLLAARDDAYRLQVVGLSSVWVAGPLLLRAAPLIGRLPASNVDRAHQ